MRTLALIAVLLLPSIASADSISSWFAARKALPFQVWGPGVGETSWLPARDVRIGDDMICMEIEFPKGLIDPPTWRPRCYPFSSIHEFTEVDGRVSITLKDKPR